MFYESHLGKRENMLRFKTPVSVLRVVCFAIFQGTWLYTDADCVLYDEEYIVRVTCVETGASKEYSNGTDIYLSVGNEDTCNESFADSTFTTATTAATSLMSASITLSQNAVQQNLINCDITLGIWPAYLTLSFLIGGVTGCIGHYLLRNKCKGKRQQTRLE